MNTKYPYIDFNGVRYYKRKSTKGYYLCDKRAVERGAYRQLHRAIWALENGHIPLGYVIHHKDGDKDNNNLCNLELLLKKEHDAEHTKERSKENLICTSCGKNYVGKKHPKYEQTYCSPTCQRREWKRASAKRKKAIKDSARVISFSPLEVTLGPKIPRQ